MAEKVKLIVAKPDKVVKKGEYWGVVLPTVHSNLTVIAGRAPSLIYLQAGPLKLLNTMDDMAEKLYVSEGVAEIADNLCTISAEYVLKAGEATVEAVKAKLSLELKSRERNFYQAVYDDLSAFPNN